MENWSSKETFFGSVTALIGGGVKYNSNTVFLNIEFAKDIEAIITGGLTALIGAIVVHLFKKYVIKKK